MSESRLAAAAPDIRLSVVIAAWNGEASLVRCLDSLGDDRRAADTEIIAVTNFDNGARDMLRTRFSEVQHRAMPPGTTVPVLRTEGIFSSRGQIVALAEDHCTFGQTWCSAIKTAHDTPHMAIGGAVENASVARPLDWAVYFYDYGKFMLPLAAGPAPALSGNNVSFKREALREVESTFKDGFFEPFTHGAIAERGHPLYLTPSAVVYHQKTYQTRAVMAHCYHLARSYAAKRARLASALKQAVLIAGSCVLPLVLTARIVLRTVQKGRNIGALVRSLPYLLLLLTAWSWGEFCGYLAGEGRSAREWG